MLYKIDSFLKRHKKSVLPCAFCFSSFLPVFQSCCQLLGIDANEPILFIVPYVSLLQSFNQGFERLGREDDVSDMNCLAAWIIVFVMNPLASTIFMLSMWCRESPTNTKKYFPIFVLQPTAGFSRAQHGIVKLILDQCRKMVVPVMVLDQTSSYILCNDGTTGWGL